MDKILEVKIDADGVDEVLELCGDPSHEGGGSACGQAGCGGQGG